MSFFESIYGLLSAIFAITGIYALGSFSSKIITVKKFKSHFNIALGFGIYQVLFIFLSIFNNPYLTNSTCTLLLLVAIILKRKEIKSLLKSKLKFKKTDKLVLLVLFFPYFCRLLSPPTSSDGLSFYLPSVAWINNYGLSFNPYLTNYTTMPSGAEYFYSLSFGFTGYSGIRWTDALFTLLLIYLIFRFCRGLMSLRFARIATILSLLIPGTFFFVFGTGKVDTIGTYLILVGFVALVENWKTKTFNTAVLIFSVALSVKYTNWLLLLLPLSFLIVYNLVIRFSLKSLFIAVIPLLFFGPVLIKNTIQVNNPLAPLIQVKSQTKFVSGHGSIPEKKVIFMESPKNKSIISKFVSSKKAIYLAAILIGLVLMWFFFKNSSTIFFDNLFLWLLYIFLSIIPWLYFLGLSNQPLRFLWPILILIVILGCKIFYQWQQQSSNKSFGLFTNGFLVTITSVLITVSYYKHGNRIGYFKESFNSNLESWYLDVGKDHYSFTQKFKELEFHKKNVLYLRPVALGLFDIVEYHNLPTDEQLFNFDNNTERYINEFQFVVAKKSDLVKHELDTSNIILCRGDYYLIRQW